MAQQFVYEIQTKFFYIILCTVTLSAVDFIRVCSQVLNTHLLRHILIKFH